MKKMKIFLLICGIIMLFFVCSGSKQILNASSEVAFRVINTDYNNGNTEVNLDIKNYSYPDYTLQYSYDKSEWFTINNDNYDTERELYTIDLTDFNAYEKVLYWKLQYDGGEVTTGDLSFSGGYPANNLYDTVTVNWDVNQGYDITIATPQNVDMVAPVPIPPSAWLLGVGLAGLLVFRRREED